MSTNNNMHIIVLKIPNHLSFHTLSFSSEDIIINIFIHFVEPLNSNSHEKELVTHFTDGSNGSIVYCMFQKNRKERDHHRRNTESR